MKDYVVKNCITVRSWLDPLELSDIQQEILAMLAEHPGVVISESELITGGGYLREECGYALMKQALNRLVQAGYIERWLLIERGSWYETFAQGYKRCGDGPTQTAVRPEIKWAVSNG